MEQITESTFSLSKGQFELLKPLPDCNSRHRLTFYSTVAKHSEFETWACGEMQLPLNERELVERAQHGDKEAVSALYESYVHTIFQYISYRVESDAVAEDLVADVFLRMVRGLPDYQYTGAPLGAWLFRIAANRITDHYRTHRRTATVPIPEDYGSSLGNPIDELIEEEERSRLRKALQALSEDYQNVLILRFMRDLPYTEVADIMDKSEGAVRVMQHRALKSLAAELSKLGHSDYGRREDEHA